MKIVLIEPYYTGSHKLWADQLIQFSSHDYHLIALPGRHWKWRMQGSAVELSSKVNNMKAIPDLFVVTDMINLSLFKSLLEKRFLTVPILLYFHENQLVYPDSPNDKDKELNRDLAYGFINYTSALVADKVLFNSMYHLNTFFETLSGFIKKMPDYNNMHLIEQIESKSTVVSPGIDIMSFEKAQNDIPVILWNHRWEYDKSPELFFESLFQLKEDGISFKLIVLGEHSSSVPNIFDETKQRLKSEIIHWGFVTDRKAYWKLLHKADLLPVTSVQDYFGISVVEAMASGVVPILPHRLAYPEHVPNRIKQDVFYHSDNDFYQMTKNSTINFRSIHLRPQEWVKKYHWNVLKSKYDGEFKQAIR